MMLMSDKFLNGIHTYLISFQLNGFKWDRCRKLEEFQNNFQFSGQGELGPGG